MRGDVPIDEGQRLPCLQVTVGCGPIIVIAIAAAPWPQLPSLFLSDALLDGGQRLGREGAKAVRSGRYKQLRHLVILLLQGATARGSAGEQSCRENTSGETP